jgi:hypothetical protein
MAQEPIPIRISGTGQVVPEGPDLKKKVKVKKTKNENVKWVAQDGGGPWIIKFDKSGSAGATYPVEPGINPFTEDTNAEFLVPRAGEIETDKGPVKGKKNHTYRYTVNDEQGIPTDDPDVDVE